MKEVNLSEHRGQLVENVLRSVEEDVGSDQKLVIIYTSKDGSINSRSANLSIAESIAFLEFCKFSYLAEASKKGE